QGIDEALSSVSLRERRRWTASIIVGRFGPGGNGLHRWSSQSEASRRNRIRAGRYAQLIRRFQQLGSYVLGGHGKKPGQTERKQPDLELSRSRMTSAGALSEISSNKQLAISNKGRQQADPSLSSR